MDHRFDPTGETTKETRPPTAPTQETLIEADIPERLRIHVKHGFFSAGWKRAYRDIDHSTASSIDANGRVAFFMRDSIDEGLTDMDLGLRFRDDFRSWGEKSFALLHPCVQDKLRNFLRGRNALSDYGHRRKISPFLAEVVQTESPEETEWRRILAIHHDRQRQRSRRTSSFAIQAQQARHAPGVDSQPSYTHRQQVQCTPSAKIRNQQAHPVPQEKFLPPQRRRDPPLPTLLQQDPVGIPNVKITAGSHHKPESAPVDKAVTDSANELLAEPRHDTPGGDEEDKVSDPLKSAAVRSCDEPKQRPDEAPDMGAPADGEELAHDEDSADIEESDGTIDDQRRTVKETLRGGFAPATYMLSPVQGSSWTSSAPKLLRDTVPLVCQFFADFENYLRLVERLIP
ncbi:hypothetical protein E4U30_000320 [Claviceps sp. LM220 group G6]|nr:hypothetical protein E4U30_000320 [Claviceps sp. LM220 group G6]